MQDLNGRKVATVFGGNGFIGRYVVERLAQQDWVVRVAGRGHAKIVEAGIGLLTGIGALDARRANLGHILRVTVSFTGILRVIEEGRAGQRVVELQKQHLVPS